MRVCRQLARCERKHDARLRRSLARLDGIVLVNEDSCIGCGFYDTGTCYNCCTCSGVRDIGDFSYHDTCGSNAVASPSTVTANNGINCDRWSCP